MKQLIRLAIFSTFISSSCIFAEETTQPAAQPPELTASQTIQQPLPTVPKETISYTPFLSMKQEEWTTYGLNKLTQEERSALQAWIQNYAQSQAKMKDIPQSEPVKLQSIQKGAKTIELADGRKFSLSPSSRKVAILWNVGDMIRVEPGKKKGSVDLYHVDSKKSIKAKVYAQKDDSSED